MYKILNAFRLLNKWLCVGMPSQGFVLQGMSLYDIQVPLAKSSSSWCALTAAGADEWLGELELVSYISNRYNYKQWTCVHVRKSQ